MTVEGEALRLGATRMFTAETEESHNPSAKTQRL